MYACAVHNFKKVLEIHIISIVSQHRRIIQEAWGTGVHIRVKKGLLSDYFDKSSQVDVHMYYQLASK